MQILSDVFLKHKHTIMGNGKASCSEESRRKSTKVSERVARAQIRLTPPVFYTQSTIKYYLTQSTAFTNLGQNMWVWNGDDRKQNIPRRPSSSGQVTPAHQLEVPVSSTTVQPPQLNLPPSTRGVISVGRTQGMCQSTYSSAQGSGEDRRSVQVPQKLPLAESISHRSIVFTLGHKLIMKLSAGMARSWIECRVNGTPVSRTGHRTVAVTTYTRASALFS